MKITAIKQQVKNSERASIFVDGKYSFSLSLSELVTEKLKNNEELSEVRLAKLIKLSIDGKLRMRAVEWVMTRPRSLREFKDYLRRKKAEPEIIESLQNEFLNKGYLNEENFTRWLVDVRSRGSKSNRAIQSELASKGISREIADEILSNHTNSEDMRIKVIIAKKSKLPRYQKAPQKLLEYLARQGFSYDLIKEHLK